MVGPAERLEPGSGASALGEAIFAALGRSHLEKVAQSQHPSVFVPAKEAGFKNNAHLECGAAYLTVERKADGVRVSAWASRHGSHSPVSGSERTCPPEAKAIGGLVLQLAGLCVPRYPAKIRPAPCIGGSQSPRTSDPDDLPVPFGYKMSWIVVSTTDDRAAAEALGLKQITPCCWKNGIDQAFNDKGIFITPPIEGWTIAAGSLPDASEAAFRSLLENLSRRFGEAFYFGTHRVSEYQAWACAKNGVLRRAFGYSGCEGEFLIDFGERTGEETELGTGVADLDNAPDESTVVALAEKWVLDPLELDMQFGATGPGLFGNVSG
jgi:hypothetical protein